MFSELEKLSVNVLPCYKAVLRRMAATDGETMAVLVRRLIRQEARERGLWPAPRQATTQGQEAQHVDSKD